MVKIPTTAGADDEGIEHRTQIFHDLGALMALWSKLELYIELAICRRTNLDPLHASIILGPLQHKAKSEILFALLKLSGESEAKSKLKAALSFAKRNALIHSALASKDDFSEFAFFYRNADDGYRVRRHSFTATTFHEHVWQFRDLAKEAVAALGLDNPDGEEAIEEYGRKAQFEGLDQ